MDYKAAFEYFDNKKEKHVDFDSVINCESNDIELITSEPENDLDITKFMLINNKTKKILYSGTLNHIGDYNTELSIWQWAWSLPLSRKSENYKAMEILQYGSNIDVSNMKNIYDTAILKSELLNSKLYIEHIELELERYIALSMYLTKSEWYLISVLKNNRKNDKDVIGRSYYLIETLKKH